MKLESLVFNKRSIIVSGVVIFAVLMISIVVMKQNLIKVENIESAILIGDAYHDNVNIPLEKQDINDVVGILNSPKSKLESHSVGFDDCCFNFNATMKDGSCQKFRIVLMVDKRVFIYKLGVDEYGIERDLDKWVLDSQSAQKAFDTYSLRKFYRSCDPIFPVVYAEGKELVGSRAVMKWKYKNYNKEWRPSGFSATKQDEAYTLKGNTLNLLFPCFPISKRYAIFDMKGTKIDEGMLTTPQLKLPDGNGTYKVELTASWDYDGVKYLRDAGKEGVPNAFRGDTKTEILISCGNNPTGLEAPMSIENWLLLMPVEQGLKELGADFAVDYNEASCTIESFDSYSEKSVRILKINQKEIKDVKCFNVNIDHVQVKRSIYFVDEKACIEASGLACDLGMVLKEKGENQYFFSENLSMYPIMEPSSYKYGYINRTGNWVIPPILARAGEFIDGYSVFSVKAEPADVATVQGHISGAQFDQFSNDLKRQLTDFYTPDVSGLLDQKGNIVLPPKYTDFNYQGGNVVMLPGAGEYGEIVLYLLDKKQETRIGNIGQIMHSGLMSEGLIPISLRDWDNYNDYYAYFNIKGEAVIPRQFKTARSFVNGRAIVGMGIYEGEDQCKLGVIDQQGYFKVPYIFNRIENYSENTACVCLETNKIMQYAYIDTEGNLLTDLKYTLASSFNSGRALANLDNECLTYIDKTFEPVNKVSGGAVVAIKNTFNRPFWELSPIDYRDYSFNEGYARIQTDGKSGFIDTMGNLVIACQFKSAEPFKNGMAKIEQNEERYSEQETYCDTLGRVIKVADLKIE